MEKTWKYRITKQLISILELDPPIAHHASS